MKKLNFKDVAVPAISLFLICLCVTALLGFTNAMTKDAIAEVQAQIAQKSRESVCPDAVSFEKAELDGGDGEAYAALDASGEVIGYAISTASRGYGGDILVMTGFDVKTNSIISVNVYDNSNETPGLGANTSKESFTAQYSGEGGVENGFVVNKDAAKAPEKQSVDAVTGATISSRAVTSAVNRAVEIYKEVGEEK